MMMWWLILIPVALVFVLFLYNERNRQNIVKRENPMSTVDNRFAHGEFTKEEHEEQKRIK